MIHRITGSEYRQVRLRLKHCETFKESINFFPLDFLSNLDNNNLNSSSFLQFLPSAARCTGMGLMGEGLRVEILAYAPTAVYHCTHCEVAWREVGVSNEFHQEQVESSLPPELAREYQEISDWVQKIFQIYGDKITVKVVDAASFEGVIKSLRYGVHRYPAVIVAGKTSFVQKDFITAAEQEIARLLKTQS